MGHHKSCCEYGGYHHTHHQHSHGHGDRCCEGTWRRFISKAEKKEKLERYKKELEAELTAVNEILSEM